MGGGAYELGTVFTITAFRQRVDSLGILANLALMMELRRTMAV